MPGILYLYHLASQQCSSVGIINSICRLRKGRWHAQCYITALVGSGVQEGTAYSFGGVLENRYRQEIVEKSTKTELSGF